MNKLRIIATALALCAVISVSAADKQYEVVKIAHDASRLYLGTKSDGLIVVDKETGRQTLLCKGNGGLKENRVRDVKTFGNRAALIDTHDRYSAPSWVEFIEDGKVTKSVQVDDAVTSLPDGLSGFGLWLSPCIAFDATGGLWLTILDSWVCRCEGDTFTDITEVAINRGYNYMITGMVFDGDGVLWLSNSYPDSLLCKMADGKVEKFDMTAWANCIAIDAGGSKWIGGDVLAKYDGEEMTFYKGGNESAFDMAFDDAGRLWLMGQFSLFRFVGPAPDGGEDLTETMFTPSGKRYHYETGVFEEYELPVKGRILNCIHADGNQLYVAYGHGGLSVIDTTTGAARNIELSPSADANSIDAPQSLSPQSEVHSSFDLQGRRIAGTLAKGVYIRDGKKVVR